VSQLKQRAGNTSVADMQILCDNLVVGLGITQRHQLVHQARQSHGEVFDRLAIVERQLLVLPSQLLRARLANSIPTNLMILMLSHASLADDLVTRVEISSGRTALPIELSTMRST
jgi:hypothetical protein